MTVATQETHIEYAGDNSSTVFALDFPFVDATCLKAVKIDGNGVSTPVTITDTTGGSQRTGWGVTISAPVGTGYTLRIYRDTPMIQPKVYTESDPFPARSHEIGLDRLTMIVQELRNALASGTFSGNPVTFIEGDELTITPILERGQIGVATDSRVILFKLQNGTVLRWPIDGAEGLTVEAKIIVEPIAAQSALALPAYTLTTIAETNLPAGFFNSHKFLDIDIPVLVTTEPPTGNLQFIGYIGETSVFGTLSTGTPAVSNPIKVRFFADQVTQEIVSHCDASQHEQPVNMNTGWGVSFDFTQPLAIKIQAMHLGTGLTANIGECAFSTYEEVAVGGGGGDAQLIGTAGGDLSGAYPNPTVVGIRGESIPSLTAGFLSYTGTEWAFAPLSAFDFVKRPGDSMTGKLEFKDGENDTEPGSIEKTVGMGFNYLDIQQAGINANIRISTENNSGEMTEKLTIGPTGSDFSGQVFIQDDLAISNEGTFLTPYVDFRDQAEPDQVKGRTFWDPENLTLTTMLRDSGGPDTKYQHGQELPFPCFNDSGVTIPSLSVVYISGSQGGKLKIALADPSIESTTYMVGVTTEEIADQEFGYVTFFGEVRNEDTSAFSQGQPVYLSSLGTIGAAPPAGQVALMVGVCKRSSATIGSIFVKPFRFPMASDIVIDVWDDIPFLRGSKVGASAPTYAQFGATAFWGWRMAAGNIFYHDDGQMPHSWDLGEIRPHIHFSSDNGGTGAFTMEFRIMTRPAASGSWSTETVATKSWTGTLAAGAGGMLDLYDGTGFQPASPGPSTLFKCVLTMTAKTFTGNIFIDGWDGHYKRNRLGTDTEF